MRGVTDDKRMDWTVHGGMAEVDGALVRLRGVALTFKPLTGTGDPVVVTSPRCEFNREDKTGNSDAPLHVHSRQVDVEGVGYDILTAQQQLHIRSQVHMKIRPDRDVGAVVPGLLHRPGTAAPAGTTKTEGTKAR